MIELLTGSPPYFELSPMAAIFRMVQDDCPPLPPDISMELQEFLLKCFEKEPNFRPTAQDLLEHRWIRKVTTIIPRKFSNSCHFLMILVRKNAETRSNT